MERLLLIDCQWQCATQPFIGCCSHFEIHFAVMCNHLAKRSEYFSDNSQVWPVMAQRVNAFERLKVPRSIISDILLEVVLNHPGRMSKLTSISFATFSIQNLRCELLGPVTMTTTHGIRFVSNYLVSELSQFQKSTKCPNSGNRFVTETCT